MKSTVVVVVVVVDCCCYGSPVLYPHHFQVLSHSLHHVQSIPKVMRTKVVVPVFKDYQEG
jgi:hypothetical protein